MGNQLGFDERKENAVNMMIVHQPGVFTTVQDLGRPGFRAMGVPGGGAMDRKSLRLANLLVGNSDGAPALECTLGGPEISFEEETWISVCGAEVEGLLPARPRRAAAGEVISLRHFVHGCRAYLAVAGGISVPPVLNSSSTYTRANFGGWQGRALRAGDRLPTGTCTTAYSDVEHWSIAPDLWMGRGNEPTVRFVPGSEWSWLTPESQTLFQSAAFRVLAQSDRMGMRLFGTPLVRSQSGEMTSEPVSEGTVQLPPDGQPIVLTADCQTVGGYPKIGHVSAIGLPHLAQLRPGDHVRFQAWSTEEAEKALLQEEASLAKVAEGLRLKRT